MNPQFELMLQQAIKAFQGGNFDGAYSILQEVLQKDITSADTIFEIAINYAENGGVNEALEIFKCLKIYVKNEKQILYNLGCLYVMQGDYENGYKNFHEALAISPNDISALVNCASALHELKRFSEAIPYYDIAISVESDNVLVWCNKGNTLRALKRYDEAIAHYDRAISLKSDDYEAWCNKGLALHELKQYHEAIVHYDKALSFKPDYAEGWFNKGITLNELKRFEEANAHYDRALRLKADIDWTLGYLLHSKMKICSWSGLAESLQEISQKVVENKKVASPFMLLATTDDALLHKKSSEIYIQSRYPFNPVLGPILERPQNQKIRVAYFSPDFRNHPVGFLIAELIEIHDRNKFELYAFSLVRADDEMRECFLKTFDHFIDIEAKSDIEIAKLARDLSIDIAVDLTGFTGDSRTGIFAHRAAPIQVNYLGYPGTMGADYIDYIIADHTLISDQFDKFYSEKVVYLPNSYQVNDRKKSISVRQFTRQELGLPESGFVFCCFNNNFKILPETFSGWMRILKAVEGAVLWVFQDNSWAVENLKNEAEKQGIAPHRLVFAERLPLTEHLARHRQADLFLDTFPYSAHTTASDALWAGLPVLTLIGNSFASRVAASLLNAIGMPELITNSQNEYENLAIDLAKNPKKLADIKLKLANNRLSTPLFNTPLFAKNIENAYIKMLERYQKDLQPDHIFID